VAQDFEDGLPDALKDVRTRPLFVMHLPVRASWDIGATPAGRRRTGMVAAGVFRGSRLSGEVLDGGADWQMMRPDGALTLDVRLALRADDGALIALTYQGLRHGPGDVLARIDKGETIDPATYYFRIAGRFETAAPQYDWLNRILAIGIGHRPSGGPIYSLFEVL
jgi:hypothetical protein